MKSYLFTLLTLILLFSFDSCKKKDENPIDQTKRISKYIRYDSLSTYIFPIKLYYDDDKFDMIESQIYKDQIIKTKFYYKDGKIDYYKGYLFPGCCYMEIGKGDEKTKYYYLQNGLLDSIRFHDSSKDVHIEYIKLGYDSEKRINSYALMRNIDASAIYKYTWDGDDIVEEEIYSHWHEYSPFKVIYYKRYYEYSDENNPLTAFNSIYFESKFLSKHLIKSEKQIRYFYKKDEANRTRTLIGSDTTTVYYGSDSYGGYVYKIYRDGELTDDLSYE